jgi:hypothetical protein
MLSSPPNREIYFSPLNPVLLLGEPSGQNEKRGRLIKAQKPTIHSSRSDSDFPNPLSANQFFEILPGNHIEAFHQSKDPSHFSGI